MNSKYCKAYIVIFTKNEDSCNIKTSWHAPQQIFLTSQLNLMRTSREKWQTEDSSAKSNRLALCNYFSDKEMAWDHPQVLCIGVPSEEAARQQSLGEYELWRRGNRYLAQPIVNPFKNRNTSFLITFGNCLTAFQL